MRSSSWSALRDCALALGFQDLGATPARHLGQARRELGGAASTGLPEWLDAGFHGDMAYMSAKAHERQDPAAWWPGARTAIVGLVSHDGDGEPGDAADAGASLQPRSRISRYAWGRDYHAVVTGMLKALGQALVREVPGATWRKAVDRSAVMEKPLAVLAGLGWIGKHGNLLRTSGSSWYFLGILLTDAELDLFEPFATEHCGTCTACIDACPTAAIVAPQVVDARRCISYLTIETRKAVPAELRQRQGSWVFGCDACQDACPWNRHRTREGDARFAPRLLGRGPSTRALLRLDEATFRAQTSRSALRRAGRDGLVRSAATSAGNSGDTSLVADLAPLLDDPAAAVRAHAAGALGRLGGDAARRALERARRDDDASVRFEAEQALERGGDY
jgi:epoxyqueuosine reductase